MKDGCDRCGNRAPLTEAHDIKCREEVDALRVALEAGRSVEVPDLALRDLWAHLRSGPQGRALSVVEATQAVSLVLDLGWRPMEVAP